MTVVPFGTHAEVLAAVPRVAAHLATGGLFAHPTETVYGLGSRPKAGDLERLAALKGRAPDQPFLLLVSSRAMVDDYGLELGKTAAALAGACWPGPLTLVLPGGDMRLPEALRGPNGGIGVRWTSHVGMATLIDALGYPVTSTSANRSGNPTPPGADGIVSTFREAVSQGRLLVLDGGMLSGGTPSTVVECTGPTPRLLRDGAVPRAEIERLVGVLDP